MINKCTIGLSALCIAFSLAVPAASASSGANIGLLECTVNGGIGLIIGSSKGMKCRFVPTGGGSAQHYTGSVGKLGLDIGVTNKSYIRWAVFASGKLKPGSLAGNYAGVTAQATVGAGLGANALVGGSDKSISLQPLSVQGQTGLNIAGGIGTMKLNYLK
jgi:Protein of unknown function (DUF992)